MKNRINQLYEKYWNYTAAFTDLSSEKFIKTLEICLDFIDNNKDKNFHTDKLYDRIQEELQKKLPLAGSDWGASQRKRINQLVKLGFIKPFLSSYPSLSRDYISANTERKRQSILSKIVYHYANFCNATTNDIHTAQLRFFIKSLEEIGSFSKKDLATLMTIDIASFGKDHANREDLKNQRKIYDVRGFMDRKKSQISHLKNILGKIDDLMVHKNMICFKTNAENLFGSDIPPKKHRDSYLQRIYKYELFDESCSLYGCAKPKCMLENRSYPVLMASHIKPYKDCDEKDQFNVNNGLLLSRNIDSLFDLGYITFDDDGTIIPSQSLEQDVKEYLASFRLEKRFINPERMKYMKYHRQYVFEKRFKGSRYKKK